MMRRLEQSHDHVIGYSLAGELAVDDVRQATSELRDDIARHGKLRLLFRLSDLSLSSFFTAMDERFRFVDEHRDDIDRVAVVTDDAAANVLARVGDVFQGVEVETFAGDDEPKAWAWLE